MNNTRALSRELGWRPIETAPKGKVILLFAVTDRKEDGSVSNWKMATGSTPFAGPLEWTWDGYRLREWDIRPTHWMPLPPAPDDPAREPSAEALEIVDELNVSGDDEARRAIALALDAFAARARADERERCVL